MNSGLPPNLPVGAVDVCEIELPQVAQVVARVHHIGAVVAIEVHQTRCSQAVVIGIAGACCFAGDGDAYEFLRTVKVLHQQHRALIRTVVAIAQYHRPAVVVHARNLRATH